MKNENMESDILASLTTFVRFIVNSLFSKPTYLDTQKISRNQNLWLCMVPVMVSI